MPFICPFSLALSTNRRNLSRAAEYWAIGMEGKCTIKSHLFSVKVHVNCSERMSPRQLWPQTGRGIRTVNRATYAPSGEWETAFSRLPLSR